MKRLQKPWFNMVLTIAITLVCMVIYINSGVLDGAGMAALILNWVPVFFGLVAIIMYWIVRIFSKKRSWIVTIIGGVINIAYLLIALFS